LSQLWIFQRATLPIRSKSLKVANAVAAAINAITGSNPPLAVVKMAPSDELKKLAGRKLFVWPAARSTEQMTRESLKADYDIAIALIEKIPTTATDDTLSDELLEIVENIADRIQLDEHRELTLEDDTTIEIIGAEHEPLYDRAFLEQNRCFASALTIQLTREELLP